MPDMKKEDVRLTVENEVLAISGERKLEKEEKGKNITETNVPTGASCATVCRAVSVAQRGRPHAP